MFFNRLSSSTASLCSSCFLAAFVSLCRFLRSSFLRMLASTSRECVAILPDPSSSYLKLCLCSNLSCSCRSSSSSSISAPVMSAYLGTSSSSSSTHPLFMIKLRRKRSPSSISDSFSPKAFASSSLTFSSVAPLPPSKLALFRERIFRPGATAFPAAEPSCTSSSASSPIALLAASRKALFRAACSSTYVGSASSSSLSSSFTSLPFSASSMACLAITSFRYSGFCFFFFFSPGVLPAADSAPSSCSPNPSKNIESGL
mmetsp:Transcript_9377/g.26776  ORF Transcript_9377/g.26776 Transcript_9377/m.26776 type:complete len:258 (-) Transcript_9377:480-1253(-)